MPSRTKAWAKFASELGAEFSQEGFWLWKRPKVVAKGVTFDTHYVGHGEGGSTTYTRIRAPYSAKDLFQFGVYRQRPLKGQVAELMGGLLGTMEKAAEGIGSAVFGAKAVEMPDVEVDYAGFDGEIVVKGDDEARVRALLENSRVRELLQEQPSIHLEAKKDELYFQDVRVITDVVRLKSLYDLFDETLGQLRAMGAILLRSVGQGHRPAWV